MTDQDKREPIEEQIKTVDQWIDSLRVELVLKSEGLTATDIDIPEIDTMLLRGVLEGYGAKFNPTMEGFSKLSQPTNKFRRPGMDIVWGKEFMTRFNSW